LIEQNNINRELLIKLKSGEKSAFRQIFNQYGPKIYRFGLSYLRNKHDAEELTQDVFMKIWEKRDHIDPSQNVKAYIFKIAVNCIYDQIRRMNLKKAFAEFSKYNFQPASESLWHEIIWKDMLLKFNTLVDQLPEKRRIIFRLSREEGLSNQQIADKLTLSKRTVENHIYRTTLYLKEHMSPDCVFLMLFLLLI
jgi:RNA polymerase sigma-70 factor (family 1)